MSSCSSIISKLQTFTLPKIVLKPLEIKTSYTYQTKLAISTLGLQGLVINRLPLKLNLMIFPILIQKRLRIMRALQGQIGVP